MTTEYESFDAILRDRSLSFATDDASPAGVLTAIEARLKTLAAETVGETTDEYRKLVAARQFIEGMSEDDHNHAAVGTDLVQMPAQTLEKVIAALERSESSDTKEAAEAPVERRMTERSVAAATRASEDFTRRRTWPLAGSGSLAATLWATREAFGADLSGVGTQVWAVGCGFVFLLSLMLLLISRHAQRMQERLLRGLYDPDCQARALENLPETDHSLGFQPRPFKRSEFRAALRDALGWYMTPFTDHFGTVDLDAALWDATQLALERFATMGVIEPVIVSGAADGFRFTNKYVLPE